MVLEHYPVEKFKNEVSQIVRSILSTSSYILFFFGSRVIGNSKPNSDIDIDIGILAKDKLSTRQLRLIKEQLDLIKTLYIIDFIDFNVVSEEFKNVAMKNIEKIDEQI